MVIQKKEGDFMKDKILLGLVALMIIGFVSSSFGASITGDAISSFPGWANCKDNKQCDVGVGDCDRDTHCLPGLKCVNNVGKDYYGIRYKNVDVCELPAGSSSNSSSSNSGGSGGVAVGSGVNATALLVPLGGNVTTKLDGKGATLMVSNNPPGYSSVVAHTSLTSNEDDYMTDVVLEVARDSIKYNSHVFADSSSIGRTFDFLGHKMSIERIGASSLVMNINGVSEIINDGDSFIGENVNNPDWVWDIGSGGKPSKIGIENDFIHNDDSDNPRKVGECIKLPNNYAEICLDGLTVRSYEYDTYTIEYDGSADLSGPGFGSVVQTIYIHTTKKDGINLGFTTTEKLWITGDRKVLYEDSNGKIIHFITTGNFDQSIGVLGDNTAEDPEISIGPVTDVIDYLNIKISSSANDVLTAKFSTSGEIDTLGDTDSHEEANELSYQNLNLKFWDVQTIGTKDEDHRTAYGIIVRNPKVHGASNEVVLDIPKKQVKAKVSVKMSSGGTMVTPPAKGTLTKQQKAEVLSMLNSCRINTIKGGDVKNVFGKTSISGKDICNNGPNKECINAGTRYPNDLGDTQAIGGCGSTLVWSDSAFSGWALCCSP
jgi:hypothetical protein